MASFCIVVLPVRFCNMFLRKFVQSFYLSLHRTLITVHTVDTELNFVHTWVIHLPKSMGAEWVVPMDTWPVEGIIVILALTCSLLAHISSLDTWIFFYTLSKLLYIFVYPFLFILSRPLHTFNSLQTQSTLRTLNDCYLSFANSEFLSCTSCLIFDSEV